MGNAVINIASIEAKINDYINSDNGRAAMRKAVNQMAKSGSTTSSGYTFRDPYDEIERISRDAIDIIKKEAHAVIPSSARSVLNAIDSITLTDYKVIGEYGSGMYIRMVLDFTDNLHRDSVYNNYKQYDGVDNIIALFNNGYRASCSTYGVWAGSSGSQPSRIRTLSEREALWFMQGARLEILSSNSDYYNAYVTLNSIYAFNSVYA